MSGNNIDSSYALKAKTKSIMGHIISTAAGKDKTTGSVYGSRRSSIRKSKREHSNKHNDSNMESILRSKNETNRALNNGQVVPMSDRPVTISAFRNDSRKSGGAGDYSSIGDDTSEAIGSSFASSVATAPKSLTSKEFHKSGESYHKTSVCYYKTVDGTFHKLPHDSYHKMTENCYVKLQNGSFRRFDDINSVITANAAAAAAAVGMDEQVQLRVKSHVKRFLNRSKSHTPATIKEKQLLQQQQLKDKELLEVPSINSTYAGYSQNNAAGATAGSGAPQPPQQQSQNRRVMVTMIEGGMPVLATSKSASARGSKAKNRNTANKVTNKTSSTYGYGQSTEPTNKSIAERQKETP